ncbi:MAG: hypothetical protein IOC82_12750 [Aestuariivirga sp.]|uniref:hypothetical protein n=1 Tax=Aestuariivirga sp. TaxID=2650926 RepID=UPI0025BA1ECE|nr:hypothetical protein [Aestuariivirga sp.]MCA3561886.1 hypothetical protein [Aestuariivirga sp.]
MTGLPFRILSTIAIALFFSSKWVRRAAAAVAVSAVMVAVQNQDMLQALAGEQSGQVSLLRALSAISGG